MTGIPRVCFVNVSDKGGPARFGGHVMCGAMAFGWIPSEEADLLEDMGWSFGWDALDDIPVCPNHFGMAVDALSSGECV